MSPKKAAKKEEDDDDSMIEVLNTCDANVFGEAVQMLNEKEDMVAKNPRCGSAESIRRGKGSVTVLTLINDACQCPRYESKLSSDQLVSLVLSVDGKLSDPHAKACVEHARNTNDVFTLVVHCYAWEKIIRDVICGSAHGLLAKGTKHELYKNLAACYFNNHANEEMITEYHHALSSDLSTLEYSHVAMPIRMMLIETHDMRMLKFHPREQLIRRFLMELSIADFEEIHNWIESRDLGMSEADVSVLCLITKTHIACELTLFQLFQFIVRTANNSANASGEVLGRMFHAIRQFYVTKFLTIRYPHARRDANVQHICQLIMYQLVKREKAILQEVVGDGMSAPRGRPGSVKRKLSGSGSTKKAKGGKPEKSSK